MGMWKGVAEAIGAATGEAFVIEHRDAVGGGCINTAYKLEGGGRAYFVKLNDASRLDMFEAEAEGLQEMARAGGIRVPAPVCWGEAAGRAYLVMEYLPLGGGDGKALAALGEKLAAMHRFTAERYGWHRDNTIGSTPQPNEWTGEWVDFWRTQRLGFQLRLAAENGYGGTLLTKGERLVELFPALFTDHRPEPSLLHGDLWSGNYAVTRGGEPVIFDPAVYYGDREADLAMTELFGGFGPSFYDAYRAAWPLDPGYKVRKILYNLYHILNHLNLFGGGYRGQAERMIGQLLAELS